MSKQLKELQRELIYQISECQPILLIEIRGWLSQQISNFTDSGASTSLSFLNVYPQLLREIHENESWIRCYKEDGQDVIDPIAEDPKKVWIKLTQRGNSYVQSGKNPPSCHRPSGIDNRSADEQVESPQQRVKSKIADLIEKDPYTYPPQRLTEDRARKEIYKSIQGRRGQQAFREKLLAAYECKCAITGTTIESLLEAAHIRPYCGGGTFDESNGLLLRADIHTLFDLGLISIDSCYMTVITHTALDGTEYANYANQSLTLPLDQKHRPDTAALNDHRSEAGL